MSHFTKNILRVYGRATDSDTLTGKLWYKVARETALHLAQANGLGDNYKMVCGIIAALSPQQSWKVNLANAAYCLRRKRFSGHTRANLQKARRIYNGEEPLSVLGGLKVRAFYQCLVSGGETQEVCIDRHAYSIYLGHQVDDRERSKAFRVRENAAVQGAYREVAREVGLLPNELQAITWVCFRREKGIVD